MGIDKGRIFRRNEQVLYKEISGSGVLIDPYRRTLVQLNPTAQKVWQLLDGNRTCACVTEELKKIFEVEDKKLEQDLACFLKSLLRREMIQ